MNNFNEMLEAAQEFTKRKDRPVYNDVIMEVRDAVPYLKKLYDETQPLNQKDFEKIIIEDFKEMEEVMFSVAKPLGMCKLWLAGKYFERNRDIFYEYKKETEAPDFDIGNYNQSTFRGFMMNYVDHYVKKYQAAISEFQKRLAEHKEFESIINNGKSEEVKLKQIKKKIENRKTPLTSKERSELREGAKIFYEHDEFRYSTSESDKLWKEAKEGLISALVQIIEVCSKLGSFSRDVRDQMDQMNTLKLTDFVYNNVKLKDLKKVLENLSTDELISLYAHWINRYEKTIETYAQAVYVLKSLGKLMEVSKMNFPEGFTEYKDFDSFENEEDYNKKKKILGDTKIEAGKLIKCDDVDRESVEQTVLKYHILFYPANDYNKRCGKLIRQGKSDEVEIERHDSKKNIIYYSYEPLTTSTNEQIGEDFEKYFSSVMPEYKHDLQDELGFLAPFYNGIYNAYRKKEEVIRCLIQRINEMDVNCGIVPNIKDSRYVIISIDGKFTYPVSVHTSKTFLKSTLMNYRGDFKVKTYIGDGDWNPCDNGHMTAKIVLPMSINQIVMAKEFGTTVADGAYKETVLHLSSLAGGRKPKSMGKITPTYIDILDGRIYEKDKTGNYVPSVGDGR